MDPSGSVDPKYGLHYLPTGSERYAIVKREIPTDRLSDSAPNATHGTRSYMLGLDADWHRFCNEAQ